MYWGWSVLCSAHQVHSNCCFKYSLNPICYCEGAPLFRQYACYMAVWAIHSRYKTLSIGGQQDVLLRNTAGITAATDFSGCIRSCPMAVKLLEDSYRVGPLYSPPQLSEGKKVETIRKALRAAVLIDKESISPLCGKYLTSSASCALGESFFSSCSLTGSCSSVENCWNWDFDSMEPLMSHSKKESQS